MTSSLPKALAAGLQALPVKRERHPGWHPPLSPTPEEHRKNSQLLLLNSLTETLEPFYPAKGRVVRWYVCGPTVYDDAHMGHARAYLTFDIMRRIMEDYFGYPVLYQMNITDIDDKIIHRARVNRLLASFKDCLEKEVTAESKVAMVKEMAQESLMEAREGLKNARIKLEEPLPPNSSSRIVQQREEKKKELQLKESQLEETGTKIEGALASGDVEAILHAAKGPLGDLLDKKEGHSISDPSIFEDHARHFERRFFSDARRLGIRDPDVVTRVTECVPEVVAFVQKIMDNGFAYKGITSVFFDTEAYRKAGHSYPKLKPQADGDTGALNTTEEEMAEGEGGLTRAESNEKRSPNDFALWKFSKAGEPRWPSPWGDGRPGWHIECSVMATDLLGTNFDIHGGGTDLKFPHHDNECAQSEAYSEEHQWVNYFLHCGHLHIKGLKMSKSLKNFITIGQALTDIGVTPRLMRLLFLANQWHKSMNFSDQSLDEAKEKERVLRSFFGSVEAVLRADQWSAPQGANDKDRELLVQWEKTEQAVHEALLNNFDTPSALSQLMGLVSFTNQYLLRSSDRPSGTILRKVARYITRLFQVFGVVDGTDAMGFTSGGLAGGEDESQKGSMTGGAEQRLVKVVDALVEFRDAVRDTAREAKVLPSFLPACDRMRDERLIDVGIRLEDTPNGPTTWKYDDPAALRREREERQQQTEAEKLQKIVNQANTKEKLVLKWEQAQYSPTEYFSRKEEEKAEKDRCYATFDPATGLPLTTLGGAAVEEKELKKLRKELAKYSNLHKEFLDKGGAAWLENERNLLMELRSQIEDLKKRSTPK